MTGLRCEQFENATLYLGDCLEILPGFGPEFQVDVLLTDPPYGLKMDKGLYLSGGKTVPSGFTHTHFLKKREYDLKDWDNDPPSKEWLDVLRGLSKYQFIFGGNFMELPPTQCFLVWDKLNGTTQFADCELIWTNLKKPVRLKRHLWNGVCRKYQEPRFHPTQKPVELINWCFSFLPENVETVLDPYMGSGSIGVSAIQMGKQFIGIEREPDWFDQACKRIEAAARQQVLF